VLALVWFLAGLVSILRAAGSTDSETSAVAIAGSVPPPHARPRGTVVIWIVAVSVALARVGRASFAGA
jgi:hypothetical protein